MSRDEWMALEDSYILFLYMSTYIHKSFLFHIPFFNPHCEPHLGLILWENILCHKLQQYTDTKPKGIFRCQHQMSRTIPSQNQNSFPAWTPGYPLVKAGFFLASKPDILAIPEFSGNTGFFRRYRGFSATPDFSGNTRFPPKTVHANIGIDPSHG